TKPGDEVVLKVKRGDEELEMKATLGKRPVDRSDSQNRMGNTLSNRRGGFLTFLQHDTVLKPNECGGPLVDLDGRGGGVNVARAGRGETHVSASEVVLALLPDLKAGKFDPEVLAAAAKRIAEADRKVSDLRAALKKAEAEKAAAEKKMAALKAELEK